MISLQDRATLLKAVTSAIPTAQSKSMQDLLILMAVLLQDYANLEQRTRDLLHILTELTMDMQKVTVDLHNMSKNKNEDTLTTAINALLQ